MKIAGFNHRGEAQIVDDHGNVVAYGELHLQDAHITGIDRGDRFALEVHITWKPELPDADTLDFDELDWDDLLR
jgi:hypothetical protein